MKNIHVYIFLGIMSFSCSNLENGFEETTPKPVVEAYLIPGVPISLSVHTEIPYSADSLANKEKPVDGLKITITSPKGAINLVSKGNGLYVSQTIFPITVGSSYSFKFDYLGKQVSATTQIPTKPLKFASNKTVISRQAIDISAGGRPQGGFGGGANVDNNVLLTWENNTNDYYMSIVESLEPNPVEIIKFPVDPTRVRPNIRFRNQPIQGNSAEIRSQSFQYFGQHALILFKLNSDYVALYQRNGNTTQNISTPPTTILNGLGIFTGVNADTLKIKVLPE